MQRDVLHVFDGSGNLLSFVDHVKVWTALKSFEDEKKALALASRLEGAAFENYRRLESEEKKNFDTIETSLKQEFLQGASDRRRAVEELRGRKWRQLDEPAAVFAHNVRRLQYIQLTRNLTTHPLLL